MAGLPASGKSTLARRLADALSAIVLDKDALRASLFADKVDYSAEQNDLVMDIAYRVAAYHHQRDPQVRVIIDGRTFVETVQLDALRAAVQAMNTSLHLIECRCSEDSARARLEADQISGAHLATDRNLALWRRRRDAAQPIDGAVLRLDTDALSIESCVERALDWVHGESGLAPSAAVDSA